MKTSTSYNHFHRLEARVNRIYEIAKQSLMPHADILKMLRDEISQDPAFKKLPRHYKARLLERQGILSDEILRYHVVYAFNVGGELPKLYEKMTSEEKDKCANVLDIHSTGKAYWLTETTKTGKNWNETRGGKNFSRSFELTNKVYY